eukprot:213402_1
MMLYILVCIIFIGAKAHTMKTDDELKDLLDAFTDCGLKKHKNSNIKLDELMNYFSDDIEICTPDGDNMDKEHKQCFHGKNSVKRMVKNTFGGKYESIDYTPIDIKWQEDNVVEIKCKFLYKEKSGCIIEVTETEVISYDLDGKIEKFDSVNSIVNEDKKNAPDGCKYDEMKSKNDKNAFSVHGLLQNSDLDDLEMNIYGINNFQFLLLNAGVSIISTLMVIACCLNLYYLCLKCRSNGGG